MKNIFNLALSKLRPSRVIVGLAVGLLVIYGDPGIGSLLIAVYAVLAIGLGIESRWSFLFALLCLILIPILTSIGQTLAANAVAVECFYLLCIGVGTSIWELRKTPERWIYHKSRGTKIDSSTRAYHDNNLVDGLRAPGRSLRPADSTSSELERATKIFRSADARLRGPGHITTRLRPLDAQDLRRSTAKIKVIDTDTP